MSNYIYFQNLEKKETLNCVLLKTSLFTSVLVVYTPAYTCGPSALGLSFGNCPLLYGKRFPLLIGTFANYCLSVTTVSLFCIVWKVLNECFLFLPSKIKLFIENMNSLEYVPEKKILSYIVCIYVECGMLVSWGVEKAEEIPH